MTARFRPKITLAETKVDWHHPTHIRFGPGRINELPEVCWQLGISAPLIVTGFPFFFLDRKKTED